jgi:ABC-type nitrate/sulfonate/bicarbonate transport system ATPase subunit
MRYLLLDLWKRTGTTVVFVTHSITEAVILSDHVIVFAAARAYRGHEPIPRSAPSPRWRMHRVHERPRAACPAGPSRGYTEAGGDRAPA